MDHPTRPMRLSLTLSFLLAPVLTLAQNWTDPGYQTHDEVSFYRIEAIYHAINFEKIDYPLLQAALFFVTNEERKRDGLPPFVPHASLRQAAQGHAEDMVKYGFYSHTSKIRIKRTVRDRLQLAGINAPLFGENICSTQGLHYQAGRKVNPPNPPGQFTYAFTERREVIPTHTYLTFARSVVKLWMDSPGHRANILNPHFKSLGCGVKMYPERTFYNMPYFMAVQNFAGN